MVVSSSSGDKQSGVFMSSKAVLEKKPLVPPPNFQYAKPANDVSMGDAFLQFQNPDPHSRKIVTLIKPSLIFSINSYSTPLTIPLGFTYIAAVLE